MFEIKITTPKNIYKITEKECIGTIKQAINSIESFEFTLYPDAEAYNEITERTTLVEVYNNKTKEFEFKGRVLNSNRSMDSSGILSKTFTCEGRLAYLHDSIQQYKDPTNYTIREYLKLLLDEHNSQVEDYKKIFIGVVDNTLDSNNNTYKGISYDTTYKNIQEDLLNTYGGVMYLSYDESDKTYLNYIKYSNYGILQTQPVQLSYNMIDINEDVDTSELFTRLYPLGAFENDDNTTRINIASINDDKFYLDNEDAIKEWGIITKIQTWDNVKDKNILKSKAQTYLENNCVIKMSVSINAIERNLLGIGTWPVFKIGDRYWIQNGLLGLKYTLRLYGKTIKLSEPYKPTLEFGDKSYSLINWQNKKNNEKEYKERYESSGTTDQDPSDNIVDTTTQNIVIDVINGVSYVYEQQCDALTINMPSSLPNKFNSTIEITTFSGAIKFKQDSNLWLTGTDCVNGAFLPSPNTKYKIKINSIVNNRFEGTVDILSQDTINWNLQKFNGAAQLTAVCFTYNEDANKSKLKYGYKTPLSRNDKSYYTNSDGTMNIDCSTFAGFGGRGRTFKNSPYGDSSKGINRNINYDWSIELPRNAAQQGKYFVENGLYFTDPTLAEVGDFVFWETRGDNPERVQDRFAQISHVAIISDEKDGEFWTLESTNISGNPVYHRKLSKNHPDKILFYGRLLDGNKEQQGTETTQQLSETRQKIISRAMEIVELCEDGKAWYSQYCRTDDWDNKIIITTKQEGQYTQPAGVVGKMWGFDCSSTVGLCYQNAGFSDFKYLTCSGGTLQKMCQKHNAKAWRYIDKGIEGLLPGDIVMFATAGNEVTTSNMFTVQTHHTAIWMGDGYLAEARSYSKGITYSKRVQDFNKYVFFFRIEELQEEDDSMAVLTKEGENCYSGNGSINGKDYIYKFQGARCTSYGGDSSSGCNIPLKLGATCGCHNMPYGTKLYIPALDGKTYTDKNGKTVKCDGVFTTNDTGGHCTDFDLYLSTYSDKDAEEMFGNPARLDVYVLEWGNYATAWSFTEAIEYFKSHGVSLSQYHTAWTLYMKTGGVTINFWKFKDDDKTIKSKSWYGEL